MLNDNVDEVRLLTPLRHSRCLAGCLILVIVALGCSRSVREASVEEYSDSADGRDQAIEEAVRALYSSYSFEDGEQASLNQILRHFTPTAQLTFFRGDSAVTMPAREFFERRRENLEQNGVELLREWETFGETERFGRIAHRISAVAWQIDTTDSVTGRGVISLQLVQSGERWLVQSMTWSTVSEDRPMPSRYDRRNTKSG